MSWKWSALLLGTLGALPGTAGGQTLSLGEALRRGAEEGFASRGSAAEAQSQAAQAAQTLQAFLPSLRVEGSYLRTTDPLGAFGAILRERAVTPAAFDPASLNHPDAIGQMGAGLVLEQPLFNLDAWYARRGAARGAEAAEAMHRWTRLESQVNVIQAYYGTVLAEERVSTLESALEAARAHQRQAESLQRNGMVTQSDVLLASVRASEIESQLLDARSSVPIARMRLALVLGSPGDTSFTLPSAFPSLATVQEVARRLPAPGDRRPDVQAAHLALEAAAADKRRATARLVPRINTFGRLDWVTPETPFGGQESWTVGIMVSWSPFTGGSELAQRSLAEARRSGAEARVEAVEGQEQLELSQAAAALEVALARMVILDATVAQSAEAYRIVNRKYQGGLATVVELFGATAQETSARLGASRARYDAIVALAERWRASGADLTALTSLEEGD